MLLGIYGDVHATRNMRNNQAIWESSVIKSMNSMYSKFTELGVEKAICLGDFFDTPRLEAKNVEFITNLLDIMSTVPTIMLLGNHEAVDAGSDVLSYINNYPGISTVRDIEIDNNLLYLPYSVDISSVDDLFKDRYIFTHHDIYGSTLAAGKSVANFGVPTEIFKEAKFVYNGHVHTRSIIGNVMNVGSLLTTKFGELTFSDYPFYYVLNTETDKITYYKNLEAMIHITVNTSQVNQIAKYYPEYNIDRVFITLEYEDSECPDVSNLDYKNIRFKKLISDDITSDSNTIVKNNLDLPSIIAEYIMKDTSISDAKKQLYINKAWELLK